MPPRASIVIPVHNAAQTLARQLQALASQVGAPVFETIVVLNRCTDSSREVAGEFQTSLRLRIIEENSTSSAAAARNAGAAVALGEYLLFCDADDVVDPRWVSALVSELDTGMPAVAGRIIVNRDGLAPWIYRLRYSAPDGRCLHPHTLVAYYALSANLGVSTSVFHQVGGFDDRLQFTAAEDVELACKLNLAGYRFGEAPDAVVRYEPRRTVRPLLRQARAYARGEAELTARVPGAAEARPPRPILGPIHTLIAALARDKVFLPRELYVRMAIRYFSETERRRALRRRGG